MFKESASEAYKTLVDLIYEDFIVLSHRAATSFLLGQMGCLVASSEYV